MAQRLADLASSSAVAAHRLSKRYGSVVAVDDVSFEVEAGEIFGIVGPNGAGKTTIVECLQGLRRPDGGDLSVLGLDPHGEPRALRRRIGSQLQESALPDRIKVWETLDLFGATDADARARDVLLREWGLNGKRNARFADLSGGQQQRLFVALALVNQPELVFLDEMTTGLDPTARREAWQLIEKIRDRGTNDRHRHPLHGRGREALRLHRDRPQRPHHRTRFPGATDRRAPEQHRHPFRRPARSSELVRRAAERPRWRSPASALA